MNYTFTTYKSIVYSVFDQFNIESSEWESRAPEWITNALLEIHTPKKLKEVTEIKIVENFRFPLPCNLKLLIGIKYFNTRLIRSTRATSLRVEENKPISEYTITDDGWVYIDGLEDGEVSITYKHFPFTFDKELNRITPLVPDTEEVRIALMWYCARQLLYRGYKHPVLTLNSNDPDVNPARAWTLHKKAAINSISSLDADAMYRMTKSYNSLISFTDIDYLNQLR